MKKFDIIIFGGGPAGASAAIALLQKGYSVAVVEKTDYTNFRTGETLPPKINQAISSLSIKNLFQQQLPVNANLSCWGSASLVENNFFSNPFGNGWHVNRNSFDRTLIAHAKYLGCKLFTESTIENIIQDDDAWLITINQTGKHYALTGSFAIDASGRNAVLVKKMQGRRINHDHLIAVSAIQQNIFGKKTSNYTLIEAVENGWWYAADLPGNAIVFNYMTDADVYKAEFKKDKNIFQRKIAETRFIQERTDKTITTTHLSSANTFIMDKQFGENWLAIGDAAMAYDPLSASGILRAVNDGSKAAGYIDDHFKKNKKSFKYYADNSKMKYKKYLHTKLHYYNLETRWPTSVFWKRRTGNHIKSSDDSSASFKSNISFNSYSTLNT